MKKTTEKLLCQCPLGLLPHFYRRTMCVLRIFPSEMCQCPLGLLPHFYITHSSDSLMIARKKCQCPLGLLPHFYPNMAVISICHILRVNALSGCYLISTEANGGVGFRSNLVSMPSRAVTSFLRLQRKGRAGRVKCVNALSGCYLISTVPLQKPRFYAVSRDCFCRYLSEYSDSNSFSCMLTIWTYLMR